MKKAVLLMVLLMFASVSYAQNLRISIGPKIFQKEIGCKINLPQQTDIVIRIFDGKKEIKHFDYTQVKSSFVKMNLENLIAGKAYTISVYDKKNYLLYSQEITKK